MENYKLPITSSFDKFLKLLKTDGQQSTSAIAKKLGITAEGARFQLTRLAEEGLVKSSNEVKGVGRPTQIWSLTDKGNQHFPDIHAELSVQLIEAVKESLGEEAVHMIIKNRGQKTIEKYRQALQGFHTLEEKVNGLAHIRTVEGYMAEWEKDEQGYIFKENHCPICVAANNCHDFCDSDLDIFQQVLGNDVLIYRIDHILSGSSHCAYRIATAPSSSSEKI